MLSPARKITNTGTRKNIGKFASHKTGNIVPYESHLERDYIYFLEIVTDEMIRVEPRLSNIKILYKYSKIQYSLEHLKTCKKYLQELEPITISQALKVIQPFGFNRQIIFRLIFEGFLQTDLMKPICSSSLIQITPKTSKYLI